MCNLLSGAELEALSNEAPPLNMQPSDAEYRPPRAAAAAAAAAADTQQQQQQQPQSAAASRPRRATRTPARLIESAQIADRDDHDMVRCNSYNSAAPPGSGTVGAQPFRVQVTPL